MTLLDTIHELYYDMVISRYMIGAGLTIMLYDWLLTLNSEMRYIWRAKWTSVKAVFLINRYFIPITLAFAAYGWSGKATFLTPYSCKVWITLDSSIQLAFFATLHWIVAMRAWALWGRTWQMACLIWTSFLLYLVASSYLTGRAMVSLNAVPVPFVDVCFGPIPGFIWSIWLPSMIFETMVFILTAIKAVHHNRQHVETPILTILYRDGFLYFIFICLNSFFNLLVWAVAPSGMVLLAKYFTTALCEVAGSHLILDLIEIGHITGASQASRGGGPHGKRSLLSGGGGGGGGGREDAFEMMPSPLSPHDDRGGRDDPHIHSQNSWKAPDEWSQPSFQESTRSITTLLQQQHYQQQQYRNQYSTYPTGHRHVPSRTKSVQWSDRYKVGVGQAF